MSDKEIKQKILEAGKKLLNEKDYHETVMDEVAQLAGVAKGTIFFHFKSKENFIKEILFSVMDELDKIIGEIVSDKKLPPLKKIRLIYDKFIESHLQNMHLFMIVRKEMFGCAPRKEEMKQRFDYLSKKISLVVEELFEHRLIKSFNVNLNKNEVVSSMLMIYATAVTTMVHFNQEHLSEIKEIFWKILLHGILNEDISVEMEVFGEKSV